MVIAITYLDSYDKLHVAEHELENDGWGRGWVRLVL